VKEVIRKILRESMHISSDAPDWVKEFHTLPREGRIAMIEKNKSHVEKLLPRIVDFFEKKFGDDLVKLIVKEKGAHYGNELYSTNKILLQFRFSDKASGTGVVKLRREVLNDLRSFFNIEVEYYGTPLELEFYKATWERF
jgi:hypothetical protein